MSIVLSHKIALDPTKEQEVLLRRAVGVARFAYNWALAEWQRQRQEGGKPNQLALRRQLNAIKRERFPWMLEVPKSVPQQAIKNLGVAFEMFFANKAGYPNFKRKGEDETARMDNGPGTFKVDGKRIRLPIIGWIKMREGLRFEGTPISAVVSLTAQRWFVSVSVRLNDVAPAAAGDDTVVGVHIGPVTGVSLSTGQTIASPRPLEANLKRLRRLSRQHSRKVKGSNNRRKSALRLARLHAKIANIRNNWCHQVTTRIVRECGVVCVHDADVRGMMQNKQLARHVADLGMYEFKKRLSYKAKLRGAQFVQVERDCDVAATCSVCGCVAKDVALSASMWTCSACGAHHHVGINAAKNLQRIALARVGCIRSDACGEHVVVGNDNFVGNDGSMKQEVPSQDAHNRVGGLAPVNT